MRIARAGLAAALVAGLVGVGMERARFGSSEEAMVARIQTELRDELDAAAEALGTIAARISATPDQLRLAPRDPAVARTLFDRASAAIEDQEAGRTGVTIYGADATPIAWAGRVFDVPRARLDASPALFVSPGAIGPRLIRVQPLRDGATAGRGNAPPFGAIVVEQSLARVEPTRDQPDTFVLSTSLVPVTLRTLVGTTPPRRDRYVFPVSSRSGSVLAEAEVSRAELAAARAQWRRNTWAAAITVLGLTLILCAGPIADARLRTTHLQTFLAQTLALAATVVGALALLLFAVRNVTGSASPLSPAGLLLIALAALALIVIAVDVVERRRLWRARLGQGRGAGPVVVQHVVAGLMAALVLAGYEVALARIVTDTPLDVLHFSLHPLGASRLAIAFGLVLLHVSAVWAAVLVTRVAVRSIRLPRDRRAWAAAGWSAGAVAGALVAMRWAPPFVPLLAAIAAAGACAIGLGRFGRELRRASQAARLGLFFAALVVPSLAMYPSLLAFAIAAKERLVAQTYGPEVLSQREDLQRRLQQAVEQIDALPLAEYLVGAEATPADRAFLVWSRTDLAKYRLTSAVELYDLEGRLVSRFALHLPEYSVTRPRARSCTWESLFDEVSPFGSSERHVLRTARGICARGRIVGTIVVRVMLDYRTLPFISTESPYLESLQPERVRVEGASGRDVEFAMYGWSRAPIIESGSTVWELPDRVFNRLVQTRQPFWDTLQRGDETFRVHLLSDRGAIYALGYPVITWPGHVINLAELALLVGVLYALLLVSATAVGAVTPRTPASARALLREVRSSFYRKLFLAYVAGAVVPVVILAFAIRTYFATQLRAGAVDAAQRTVTTAQRLIEDYAAIQPSAQPGSTELGPLDDQSMVLVWRAIDEDVNLFQRARLEATSARDLFASALLSTRTPGDVYKSILLDRAPTFVGDEKIGDVPYRLAAAPVRAGGREGIVTVPLTNRQNEIEGQIDELDRRVRSAAVLFSLLGAAIGYWMAERIADPVNRLTRATRRIARGDLDARIAATSSDELRRLVEDFNSMAADLQRQRTELERTQRLEAWADMARQVAHDIKNPLTPIQLSAEHARRVNLDRGRPLSPVLDECVNAILTQVRLLRQIAAEFSSFASSPTPRPETTDLAALIEEVVEPYRLGLSGRIEIAVHAPEGGAQAMIDRTLFARALTNIIENALHAMPGAGRLTITIDRRPSESPAPDPQSPTPNPQSPASSPQSLVVEITDTGVGMDEEALSRIFEPYFSTKATGTGLGLTIARRNVDLVGGRIEVRSRRDVGTTVTIYLPAL